MQTVIAGLGKIKVADRVKDAAAANVEAWLSGSLFLPYRPAIISMIERGEFSLLLDSFYTMLPFGTGGRRGAVGVGPNRMNPFTVTTSVQGHCEFLRTRFPNAKLSVVVAADVRCFTDINDLYDRTKLGELYGMTSKRLSMLAARVYAANGVTVHMVDPTDETYLSTPELSFLIFNLKAHGGLNISASHNHPDDNGAKFYNAAGGQEVPPYDEELIRVASSVREAGMIPFDEAVDKGLVSFLAARQREAYINLNLALSATPEHRDAFIAFSPLHGTGMTTVLPVLEKAGFQVVLARAQQEYDGAFPNVPYRIPNPEFPSAMEEVILTAGQNGCDLALASDPDADRLGVAIPQPDGEWRCLTGNQIGILMTYHILAARKEKGELRSSNYVVKTEVTTEMVARMAADFGVRCVGHLLVGFKYVGDLIDKVERTGRFGDMEAAPEDFLAAMEESHGVLASALIRDKDAANGALLIAELAAGCKARGKTLWDQLLELYRRYGYFGTALKSVVMEGAAGLAKIKRIQQSLRANPPSHIAGRKVVEFYDRQDESGPFGAILSETERNSRDVLVFLLEGGCRLVLRPSGTEAKSKSYAEMAGAPLGESIPDDELQAHFRRINGFLEELLGRWETEMLARLGIDYPAYATHFSGTLPLAGKLYFIKNLEPELETIAASNVDPGIAAERVVKLLRDVGPPEMLREGLVRMADRWPEEQQAYWARVVGMLDYSLVY